PPRPWPQATRTAPSPAACTSGENAASTAADQQVVQVTHPFHPLRARRLPCVGRRFNREGERLLLQAEDGAVWSVPPQWTDLSILDPEVVISDGRAPLRVTDLMALADLVERLSGRLADRGGRNV
ncbi:MAG: hypothetical protein HQL38_18890, partial [Alphaproteobacteria bacterium]|nr:hypothetical protein [Alphaproteobacteria bacterium]